MRIPHVVRPLHPPIVRTAKDGFRRQSPFTAVWSDTLDLLSREIEQLGAPRDKPWVLQVDVPEWQLRNDGGIYARATPFSPGVRVSFESRHGPLTYSADRFSHWQDNVRAIALSLEALRKVDRYGVAGHGEQYRGWTAISNRPAQMTREQAAEFLAYQAGAEHGEIEAWANRILRDSVTAKRAYLLAARRAHPDITGDDGDTMARLNAARDLLTT
jgi:hypothetical protein